MVFSSTVFLFWFLPITLAIYYLPVKNRRAYRNVVLLLASLLFYAWGEPIYVGIMILSILVTWLAGLHFAKGSPRTNKIVMIMGTVYHVSMLFVFKYLTFISNEVARLGVIKHSFVKIALPIGISFFTFQMMSYIFDVYSGKCMPQKNILYLGLYVSMFPQLIAGPIVRYEQIEDEILHREETLEGFEDGLKRFVLGLGKKMLLADCLAMIADDIFSIPMGQGMTMLMAWIGAIAFTLEIYFDFSGYSDMAIGLGRIFGFHFAENFRYPYQATSINDFWKRWHISMTNWFRDYLYIPLGGNRVSKGKVVRNIVIVWICTGIWHGANWTFLLWGIMYCVFQLLEKYVYDVTKLPMLLRRVYTLLIVCLCWVIFKARDISSALQYFRCMFGAEGICDELALRYLKNGITIIALGMILSTPWINNIRQRCDENPRASMAFEIVSYIVLLFVLVMASFISISGGYSPFIYFDF